MSLVRVEYMVKSVSRTLDFNNKIHPASILELKKQPGGPVDHWGSMPHELILHGLELELGDDYVLTLEKKEETK